MGNQSMIRWRPFELFVWMGIQSNPMQSNQQLVRDNRINDCECAHAPRSWINCATSSEAATCSGVRPSFWTRHKHNVVGRSVTRSNPDCAASLSRANETAHGIEQTRDIGLGEMDGGWRTLVMDLLAPWSIRSSMH